MIRPPDMTESETGTDMKGSIRTSMYNYMKVANCHTTINRAFSLNAMCYGRSLKLLGELGTGGHKIKQPLVIISAVWKEMLI